MILMLIMIVSGDFTYQAAPGTWLDYARSGQLSKNRILVVEQTGAKGEYHGDARQKVFDDQGRLLYEIPQAQGAWFVRNGLLGDEDTFLFQNRTDASFRLWRPGFTPRPLVLRLEGVDQVPGSGPDQKFLRILNQGSRVAFFSRPVTPLGDGKARQGLRLQILDFQTLDPAHLFAGESLPFKSYQVTDLSGANEFSCDRDRLVLFNSLDRERSYSVIDLSLVMTDEVPVMQYQAAFQFQWLTERQGFLAYTGHRYEEDVLVMEKVGGDQLFALAESDKERPGYSAVLDVFHLASAGRLDAEDYILSCRKGDTLIWYDTASNILRHYPLPPGPSTGLVSSLSTLDIQCNDRVLSVRHVSSSLDQLGFNPPAPLLEVKVNTFKKAPLTP